MALATGRVQFVLAGPAPIVLARAKGADVRAIFLNIRRNFYYTVIPENSPIKGLTDFKGKTVGVFSYGTPSYRLMRGALARSSGSTGSEILPVEGCTKVLSVAAITSGCS